MHKTKEGRRRTVFWPGSLVVEGPVVAGNERWHLETLYQRTFTKLRVFYDLLTLHKVESSGHDTQRFPTRIMIPWLEWSKVNIDTQGKKHVHVGRFYGRMRNERF